MNLQNTYFIAEIGANHEGSLTRACWLVELAARAGASAVKFQHYRADTLASEVGFERLSSLAHYSDNPHRVFRQYEIPWEWTPILAEACRQSGVDFLSTPYDLAAVDHLDPYVAAFKIGSGDITYTDLIAHVVSKKKQVLLATGASSDRDVSTAVSTYYRYRTVDMPPLCIMQCNTNYDVDINKGIHANLNVLGTFKDYSSQIVLGYSDHTLDSITTLGAVALGARVIEKHFTDNRTRNGPDHPFAIEPREFQEMVSQVQLLEAAMGSGVKQIEANEQETVVLQRRCLRAARDLPAGHVLTPADVVALRPAPEGSVPPSRIKEFMGRALKDELYYHDELYDDCI